MERHAALHSLSHDHHHGLVQARHLNEADASQSKLDLQQTARAFLAFWQTEGNRHFQDEENLLLPVYARRTDPKQAEIVDMLAQHAQIRRDALDVELALSDGGPISPQHLDQLGRRLREHIRFEERTVFPMIEQALTEEDLLFLSRRFGGD